MVLLLIERRVDDVQINVAAEGVVIHMIVVGVVGLAGCDRWEERREQIVVEAVRCYNGADVTAFCETEFTGFNAA